MRLNSKLVIPLLLAVSAADPAFAQAGAMSDMPSMPMAMMQGQSGDYAMMRDGSGTSWQPDATPMDGPMGQINGGLLDGWDTMLHGFINAVYDHQAGPRGATDSFSESMLMAMAQKQAGIGTLTLRSMVSLDPFMGKRGYPLLLQTGETANGTTPLIDRQHPHNLFMELAGTYSVPVNGSVSLFGYAGYPGEPALGPPAFMHRFSAMDDPAAPLTHHWLDSTHITFGVLTGGVVVEDWKLEASAFNGREPDQNRFGFNALTLDSASVRLNWNPSSGWAFQTSYGYLKSPEQLTPNTSQNRTTASAIYDRLLDNGNWQTTLAWGRDSDHPGHALDAFLLETAVTWGAHTLFARAENVSKDELFLAPDPNAGRIFHVDGVTLGYVYDVPLADDLAIGLGASGTLNVLPGSLATAYGGTAPLSYMLFTRIKLTAPQ